MLWAPWGSRESCFPHSPMVFSIGVLLSAMCILIDSLVSWITCNVHLILMSFWVKKKKKIPQVTKWSLIYPLGFISEVAMTAWGAHSKHNGARGNIVGTWFPCFPLRTPHYIRDLWLPSWGWRRPISSSRISINTFKWILSTYLQQCNDISENLHC